MEYHLKELRKAFNIIEDARFDENELLIVKEELLGVWEDLDNLTFLLNKEIERLKKGAR